MDKTMRLIVASIQDYDVANLVQDLAQHGWRVTHVANTGGSFRDGASTLLIGVEQTQVRQVLRLIDEHCGTSGAQVVPLANEDDEAWLPPTVVSGTGGAAVSVLKVVRFERL